MSNIRLVCLDELEPATTPAEYRQVDARLHLSICSVCEPPERSGAYSVIQVRTHQFLSENSDQQHRQLVRAILDGDADTRFVMKEHGGATAALLKGLLR